jgi:hypothetical protein
LVVSGTTDSREKTPPKKLGKTGADDHSQEQRIGRMNLPATESYAWKAAIQSSKERTERILNGK